MATSFETLKGQAKSQLRTPSEDLLAEGHGQGITRVACPERKIFVFQCERHEPAEALGFLPGHDILDGLHAVIGVEFMEKGDTQIV